MNNFEIDENKEKQLLEKYANFYFILDYWLKLYEEGKSVKTFFDSRDYKKIAIYGMASLGQHLKKQLMDSDVTILFCIDSGKVYFEDNVVIPLDSCKSALPNIDAVVVTPITEFESIRENIREYVNCDIVSIEEVILSI